MLQSEFIHILSDEVYFLEFLWLCYPKLNTFSILQSVAALTRSADGRIGAGKTTIDKRAT